MKMLVGSFSNLRRLGQMKPVSRGLANDLSRTSIIGRLLKNTLLERWGTHSEIREMKDEGQRILDAAVNQ